MKLVFLVYVPFQGSTELKSRALIFPALLLLQFKSFFFQNRVVDCNLTNNARGKGGII